MFLIIFKPGPTNVNQHKRLLNIVLQTSDILVMKFILVLVLVSFCAIIFILFSFSLLKSNHFSFYLVFMKSFQFLYYIVLVLVFRNVKYYFVKLLTYVVYLSVIIKCMNLLNLSSKEKHTFVTVHHITTYQRWAWVRSIRGLGRVQFSTVNVIKDYRTTNITL